VQTRLGVKPRKLEKSNIIYGLKLLAPSERYRSIVHLCAPTVSAVPEGNVPFGGTLTGGAIVVGPWRFGRCEA
jgi:hypothetical protein